MYGIVNKAIEELIVENFGESKWELIKQKSEINIDYFISSEPYDDDVTFKLASTISEELNIPISQVLILFGEWWILKTGKEKYGYLLESGGENLKEFLINLPLFHNRVFLIYPNLTPPEFNVTDISENSLHLHYYSKRIGLQEFVRGLIQGLGKFYNCAVEIELIESRDQNSDHEVFKIVWK
jgi:hypothetical protein